MIKKNSYISIPDKGDDKADEDHGPIKNNEGLGTSLSLGVRDVPFETMTLELKERWVTAR